MGGSTGPACCFLWFSIVQKPLTAIRPSAENDKRYRPVSASDPEILALAESIQQIGLQKPIAITLDDSHPERPPHLRECNRQRVKTLDEIAREEIVSANPEEAYRVLLEHRRQQARGEAETITLVGTKRRAQISKAKEPMRKAVLAILQARRDFWPLTERQIHYALLNDPPLVHANKPQSRYRNTVPCYKATGDLVTRARLEGLVPFSAIEDPTRPVEAWHFHRGPGSFVQSQLDQAFHPGPLPRVHPITERQAVMNTGCPCQALAHADPPGAFTADQGGVRPRG
jgi:hypothetical protein